MFLFFFFFFFFFSSRFSFGQLSGGDARFLQTGQLRGLSGTQSMVTAHLHAVWMTTALRAQPLLNATYAAIRNGSRRILQMEFFCDVGPANINTGDEIKKMKKKNVRQTHGMRPTWTDRFIVAAVGIFFRLFVYPRNDDSCRYRSPAFGRFHRYGDATRAATGTQTALIGPNGIKKKKKKKEDEKKFSRFFQTFWILHAVREAAAPRPPVC